MWREMCASDGGARTVAKLELCRILLRRPSARRRHPQGSRACPGAPRPKALLRQKGFRVRERGSKLFKLGPFGTKGVPSRKF